MARKAIIIGAGPAGLTAAYELLSRSDIEVVIIEADKQVGGLSRTINYNGNRIDIGGHRFFSKSEKIIAWWLDMLPLEKHPDGAPVHLRYRNNSSQFAVSENTVADTDDIMMVRPRKSRIYYQNKFFDYPLQINLQTLRKLGFTKVVKIGISFFYAKMFPEKPELNLAQFFKNRFGQNLYDTFFRAYTEKVWGVKCEDLPASWGHQRVKDLNFSKAFMQAFRSIFFRNRTLLQEGTSTSLIEQFLYPKFGPGQMWETVAKKVEERGGGLYLNKSVTRIITKEGKATGIEATDRETGEKTVLSSDYIISTMPVIDLINAIEDETGKAAATAIADGLVYRNFIIVGLLVNHRLATGDKDLKDNWIYLQDSQVKAGRMQIFNNWSEHMVKDSNTTWLGVEYFCDEGDELWNKPQQEMAQMAIDEICRIGLIKSHAEVVDHVVEKIDKAYPAYTGAYDRFEELKQYLEKFKNIFLIGRNGMHRYNNTDHSMLTAITAVDNILAGKTCKENIWEVNLEEEYHEETT